MFVEFLDIFAIMDARLVSSACILIILVYAVRRLLTSPRLSYPPGPKGYPIIGNIFHPLASGEYQWLAYKKLADALGQIRPNPR